MGGVRGGELSKGLTRAARDLRNNLTEAEKYLWYMLRVNNLGVKFRRQAVIGQYIVDFVCFEMKLIVEADGGQHAGNPNDQLRDQWLVGQGFKVLRFWNDDVIKNRDGVLQRIIEHLSPSRPPMADALPTKGREGDTFYESTYRALDLGFYFFDRRHGAGHALQRLAF